MTQQATQCQQDVPQLRFPEFSGAWEVDFFRNIAKRSSGRHDPKKSNINYPCIELECIQSKTGVLLKTIDTIGLDSTKNLFEVGDILFSKLRPYLKKFYKPNFIGACTSEIWVLKNLAVTSDYLYSLVQTEKFIKSTYISSGSKMPRAEWMQVANTRLFYPIVKEEQQKIADFLTAVDERVEGLRRKKALLEQYKKGLMQKIFNQDIRFTKPDGSPFPDWQEARLGDICEYRNGGAYENDVISNGAFNLITLNSIDIKGKLKLNHKTIEFSDKTLSIGDLVMVLSDIAHGNFLGLTAIIPSVNYVLNQRMGALKPIISINKEFLRYIINFNQKYFKLMGQGSSQQNLSKGDILNFTKKMPHFDEQQLIANFISSVDEKIEAVNNQLSKAQAFKKGLLQQMFV